MMNVVRAEPTLLAVLLTVGEVVEIGDRLHVGLCRIILAFVRAPLLWFDCAQIYVHTSPVLDA